VINESAGWWSPGEFCFHPAQTVWYFECYEVMARGDWPLDPFRVRSETLSPHAYFETPIAVWIEFQPRFNSTGIDGEMAILKYAYQMDYSRIALLCGCDYSEVDDKIERAIKYISTKRRRKVSYWRYCNHAREKNAVIEANSAFLKKGKKKI